MIRPIRIFIAAAALAALATGARADGGKPLTMADKAEIQNLYDNVFKPITAEVSAASSVDAAQACTIATATEQKAIDYDHRVTALRARLTAEGKAFDDVYMLTSSGDLVKEVRTFAKRVCGPAGSPEGEAEFALIKQLMVAATKVTSGYSDVDSRTDNPAYCRDMRAVIAAFDELHVFLVARRGKMAAGSAVAKRYDFRITQYDALASDYREKASPCPAA